MDTHEGHQARCEKRGSRSFQMIIFYLEARNYCAPDFPLAGAFGVVPERPKRTTDDDNDDDDPKKIFRLARDRACWPAGAASGRWAWRGRGAARRGSRRVRVVCRAERRRDKFKRQRRSGVMVCVSVFVTHQEARARF